MIPPQLRRRKIYPGYVGAPAIYVAAQMMLCGGELMPPPLTLPTPCTDSTFDNEEEMLFFFFSPQLRPQTTFEDKRQTANSGAPRDEGGRERERWNKKKKKNR